ncbi:MAG TPA: tetratricopeptide repeat protein [Planktothrix sp.]|jgi:tetratricopeptide (TPR) repeat protein
MKPSAKVGHTALALLLVLSSTMPVFAATDPASDQLDKYETTVFGAAHKSMGTNERISGLEKSLFGKTKTGSTSQRMAAIGKSLGAGNFLMPPMAGKMDTASASDSSPPVAPEGASNSYRSDQIGSAQDADSDREKETLKQAMSLYSKGDSEGAERAFKQVVAMDNKSVDAYFNLGVIAEGKGDLQSALMNYRSAYHLRPADDDLKGAVSSVEQKLSENKVASQQAAEQAHQQQAAAAQAAQQDQLRDRLKPLTEEASAAFKAGNFDKAIQDLQRVAGQAPSDPDVQFALAQAYRGKGQTQQAKVALSRALSLDPNNQMYRSAMNQLNDQLAQSGGMAGGAGLPASAPDYNRGSAGASDGVTAFNNDGAAQNLGQNGAAAGQLTPFSSQGQGQLAQFQQGYAFHGSGSGFGGFPGFGGMGMGGGYGGGYPASTSTRLKRAALSAGIGATTGALMNGMMAPRGYKSQYAMRGAMTGALMGIFMGALR